MQCKIITSSPSPPYENHGLADLQGQVNITTEVETTIYGLGLLFEGRASATLISKQKSLLKVRRSYNYFILIPLECKHGRFHPVENYNAALPSDQAIEWNCKKVKLKPGLNTFLYSIALDNEQILPTAFKHELGSIQYRIAVYLKKKQNGNFSRVTETIVNIPNYYHIPHLANPAVIVTKSRRGSEGKLIEATLTLVSPISVPGEKIQFILKIINKNAGRIQSISVVLIRNLAFFAATFSKSEFAQLCRKDLDDSVSLTQDTVEWESSLAIPTDTLLSFRTNQKCLEVFYFVQLTVTLVGNGNVQAEIPVQVVSSIGNRTTHGSSATQSPLGDTALSSACGGLSKIPPPPSYEETMRNHSESLETLPPAYEDL